MWDFAFHRGCGPTGSAIGGTDAGDRNVISGSASATSIQINGPASSGTVIRGNYIGTDVSGTLNLGNTTDAIYISFADDNLIGGTAAGEGRGIAS